MQTRTNRCAGGAGTDSWASVWPGMRTRRYTIPKTQENRDARDGPILVPAAKAAHCYFIASLTY